MITLKRACPKDASALLAAKIDAFSEDVCLYGYGPPGYDSLENISRAICHPDKHYLKILADGRLIGGLCVQDMGDGHFHLNSLYIFTDYQSEGAGTAAMCLLFQMFPRVTQWTTETPHLSVRNHRFYEKLGFVKTGDTAPEDDGFYLFLYEKKG